MAVVAAISACPFLLSKDNPNPKLWMRRVDIKRGDAILLNRPFTDVREGDRIRVISYLEDPVHNKTYLALSEPGPTKNPATEGRVTFVVEEAPFVVEEAQI